MNNEGKRVTVSVTSEMMAELDREKRERYYSQSQSAMVRDLIERGMKFRKRENKEKFL